MQVFELTSLGAFGAGFVFGWAVYLAFVARSVPGQAAVLAGAVLAGVVSFGVAFGAYGLGLVSGALVSFGWHARPGLRDLKRIEASRLLETRVGLRRKAREAVACVDAVIVDIERGVFSAESAALETLVRSERHLRRMHISLFAALGLPALRQAERERLFQQITSDLQDLNTDAAHLKSSIGETAKIDAMFVAVAGLQDEILRRL